jgi:hypothetical protein
VHSSVQCSSRLLLCALHEQEGSHLSDAVFTIVLLPHDSDRPLETMLDEFKRLKDEYPDRILIASIMEVGRCSRPILSPTSAAQLSTVWPRCSNLSRLHR